MLEDEPTLTCLTPQETIDHIVKILQEQSKNLRIMHVNTQSVVLTFHENLLITETYLMDIVAVSETWLNPLLHGLFQAGSTRGGGGTK